MTLQPAQGGQRFAPGRATTPVMVEISELVVGMAKSNPRWGYTRIRGALSNLGHTRPVQKHKRTQDWRAGPFRSSSTCGEPQFWDVSEAMSAIRVPAVSKNTNELKTGAPGRFDRHRPVGCRAETWTRTC